MTYFHIYSFILAALPLLLGFLFIWFGKKLWNNAAKKNEEYQQRYTGHTTLRVIRVEKNEWEETNSNEQWWRPDFLSSRILQFTSIR